MILMPVNLSRPACRNAGYSNEETLRFPFPSAKFRKARGRKENFPPDSLAENGGNQGRFCAGSYLPAS